MLTPLKWIAPGILVVLLIVVIGWSSSVQNVNTSSIKEVESLAETVSVGSIRSEVDDEGVVDSVFFDRDELIAYLTSAVVEVQKSHEYDLKIDYVFFDEDKNVTDDDEKIRSVQFRVEYLDDDGKVKASAERHLAVNLLN